MINTRMLNRNSFATYFRMRCEFGTPIVTENEATAAATEFIKYLETHKPLCPCVVVYYNFRVKNSEGEIVDWCPPEPKSADTTPRVFWYYEDPMCKKKPRTLGERIKQFFDNMVIY